MKTLFSTLFAIALAWLVGAGASAEAAGLMRPVDGAARDPVRDWGSRPHPRRHPPSAMRSKSNGGEPGCGA